MTLGTKIKRLLPWFMQRGQSCEHVATVQEVTPSAEGCEECLEMGDRWVHLRICLNCGHVGCCDYSKNKHATRHFQETGHPIVRSFEPGESWIWCYVDKMMLPDEAADE